MGQEYSVLTAITPTFYFCQLFKLIIEPDYFYAKGSPMDCCSSPDLLPIDEAIAQMLSVVSPVKSTLNRPLLDTLGQILADDILSPISVPPFDNSAMDGYAIRRDDLKTTTSLPIAGKSFAGQPFQGDWPLATCIRIMTGAKIPSGCDAVIMQEQTQQQGNVVSFLTTEVKPLLNIRPIGDDIKEGDIVLNKGHKITPRDLPLIASLGISHLHVYRKPRVAFFSTGDELVTLGTPLEEGQIYDSNRYGIQPLLENFGCDIIDLGIIPDDPEQLKSTFIKAQALADVVITSGGVSVGEADFTKDILASLGQINFWKIAIKPGKPFAFGQLKNALFCGLPGNPVSAALTLYVLVQPLLARLAGHSEWQPPQRIPAITRSRFKKSAGRTDFQRGFYQVENGQLFVESAGNQSSGAFRSMSFANSFVVLEKDRGNVEVGETVEIELFNPSLY
jgi:molybdopterin molybdotransferase